MQVRRARAVIVYWNNSQLVFENFLTRTAITADPITIRVLHLCDQWRTPAQLCSDLAQYSRASVRDALRLLTQHSLLVEKGTSKAERDEQVAQVWSHWLPHGSFHFATKDVNFVHGKERTKIARRHLKESLQPPFFKRYSQAPTVLLPRSIANNGFVDVLFRRRTYREFSGRKISLETISQLLYCTWGVTGYYETIFGRLAHKTSPSGGARHPGEVYLVALHVSGLSSGMYHYDPRRHHLKLLRRGPMQDKAVAYCAGQTFVKNASAVFLMTAVFPRSMWKYRFARAYRVVTLDAGHLCQTFCLTATSLGLAPFCTAALKDSLIEKDLGLDGITESALYVAAVGYPRRPLAN